VFKKRKENRMYHLKNAMLKSGNTYWIGTLFGFSFERNLPLKEDMVDLSNVDMTINEYFDYRGIDKRFADIIKKVCNADENKEQCRGATRTIISNEK
jgi:hypothetical protein